MCIDDGFCVGVACRRDASERLLGVTETVGLGTSVLYQPPAAMSLRHSFDSHCENEIESWLLVCNGVDCMAGMRRPLSRAEVRAHHGNGTSGWYSDTQKPCCGFGQNAFGVAARNGGVGKSLGDD